MEERYAKPITAAPTKDQLIIHENKTYTTIREGKAHILVPPNARTSVNPTAKAKAEDEQKVFYNPIQQFNRDLSVLAIKAYGEDLCRRKTTAREVRKKREEGKRERKKQKKAEVAGYDGAHGDGASESTHGSKVDDAESVKKRKRADGDVEGEAEGHVQKAQKAGDGDDPPPPAATPTAEAETIANGARRENGEVAPDSSTLSAADGIETAGAGDLVNGSAKPPDKPWQPSFRVLDALSATGLRALRYATEIPSATAIVANDRDRGATAAIALNVQHNDLSSKITTSTGDAMGHMYAAAFPPPQSHGPSHINGKYDVIDLDPYGTAAPFIDAALQALNDDGLLCVTCTDSGVYASCGYSEKTLSLYGGMPIKGTHAHEGGLRLILHSIATSAAKYSLAIEPLLSLSIDFYARVFLRVRKSPADVKFLAGKTMLVYECDVGCGAWSTQHLGRHQRHGKGENAWKFHISMAPTSGKLCEHCGSKTHIAGPMWGGPLHNAAFIEKILEDAEKADVDVYQTLPRVEGMLDTALSELLVVQEALTPASTPKLKDSEAESTLQADPQNSLIPTTPAHIIDHHPFYTVPSALCKVIKAVAPPEAAIRGALRKLGYVATRSHAKAGSLKTDAPWSVLWELMREWVRQRSPVKFSNLREAGPGFTILSKTRNDDVGASKSVGQDDDDMRHGSETSSGDGGLEITTTNRNTANGDAVQQKSQPEPGKELEVSKLDVVFDEKLGRDQETARRGKGAAGRKRLVRYQQNPRENWGPMARAKGGA